MGRDTPDLRLAGVDLSNCESFEYEVVAAGVSGDLAYMAGIEHTTASVGGGAPARYSLRVTTILRREDGEWKVVHRHGDPVPDSDSAGEQLERLKEEEVEEGQPAKPAAERVAVDDQELLRRRTA